MTSSRLHYLAANAFELFVCLLAALAAVEFYLHPAQLNQTATGHLPDYLPYIWNTLYGVGALFCVLGLWLANVRLELAGLSLFTAATAISLVAIVVVFGIISFATIGVYVGFIIASVVRARFLVSIANRGRP